MLFELGFGFSHWEMEPDILTLAKGLTAGTMPFGATVVSNKIADYFQNNYHTYATFVSASASPVDLELHSKLIRAAS